MAPGTATSGEEILEVPKDAEAHYVTTAFTALHFLDPDPDREAEIEARFGPAVLERMKRDRSLLIRRTFGTLPLHLRPRSERVVNLFDYEGWISGGHFPVPVFFLINGSRPLGRLIAWLWEASRNCGIRNVALHIDAAQPTSAAVRKIARIRGPGRRAPVPTGARCSILRLAWGFRFPARRQPGSAVQREQICRFCSPDQVCSARSTPNVSTHREKHAPVETVLDDGPLQRIAESRDSGGSVLDTTVPAGSRHRDSPDSRAACGGSCSGRCCLSTFIRRPKLCRRGGIASNQSSACAAPSSRGGNSTATRLRSTGERQNSTR